MPFGVETRTMAEDHVEIWEAIEGNQSAITELTGTVDKMVIQNGTIIGRLDVIERLVDPLEYIADTFKIVRYGIPIAGGIVALLIGIRELYIALT